MNREDLRTVLKLMNEGYKEMNVEFEDKTDFEGCRFPPSP